MKDTLPLEDAYRAMHRFVTAYWERGDELMLFLKYSGPGNAPTVDNPVGSADPAAWNDWLGSVRATTGEWRRPQ